MAKTAIDVGSSANDGTGDPLRTAMQSTNSNFTELYTLLGNGTALSISGDVTMSAGAVTIANDAVETAMIATGAVDTTELAADAVDGTKIADDSVNSEHYVDGSIDTAHIADDQVTAGKLADEFTAAQAVTSGAAITLDGGAYDVFTWTSGHSTTLAFTNITLGMTKSIIITGSGGSNTVAFGNINGSSGTFNLISGTYSDAAVKNLIQLKFISTSECWYTISQISS